MHDPCRNAKRNDGLRQPFLRTCLRSCLSEGCSSRTRQVADALEAKEMRSRNRSSGHETVLVGNEICYFVATSISKQRGLATDVTGVTMNTGSPPRSRPGTHSERSHGPLTV